MVFHLIKKDILIAKKLVLVAMLAIIATPVFFTFVAAGSYGFFPFLYTVFMSNIILMQNISALEAKNPKAPALLCAAPYTRKTLIIAKYVLFLLLFVYCYLANTIFAMAADPSSMLDLSSVLFVLSCGVLFFGIYMPIEVKYGFVKAKFVFQIIILILAFGPIIYSNLFAGIDFSGLMATVVSIPIIVRCSALAVFSALFFSISMTASIRIFADKEL
jgi:ABC-2 type transport system permease protein